MKRLFQITILALLVNGFAFTALAQKQKSKEDYIKEISALNKTKTPEDLGKMYVLIKEYLAKFKDEKSDNINKFKEFVKGYREDQFYRDLDKGKYNEAFAAGKEILAETPENVAIIMNLAYGGFDALSKTKDASFKEQSVAYAKQTLSLLEAGKTPANFAPFKDKNDLSAWMYYIIGDFAKDTDIKEAAINFYKATQFEAPIKNTSYPYYVVAVYYEDIYQKAATAYNAKAKTMTDAENDAELKKVNKIIDLMLDAYARSVKLAEAENIPQKTDWKQRLTDVYKFRKKTDAGVNEFITLINSSPMPDPGAY